MSGGFLSSIVEGLGKMSFGNFTSMFIPNQALPAENFLITKLSYGVGKKTQLNNAVRMAEVADGVIVKVPMIQAVKIPFTLIQSVEVNDSNNKLNLKIKLMKDGLGQINMTFPNKYRGQIPYLLNHKANSQRPSQKQVIKTTKTATTSSENKTPNDLADWSIPKSKTKTPERPPIQLNNIDFGGFVRKLLLIAIVFLLVRYLFFTYGYPF